MQDIEFTHGDNNDDGHETDTRDDESACKRKLLEKVKWKKTHNAEKEVKEVLPVTQDKEAQVHLLESIIQS